MTTALELVAAALEYPGASTLGTVLEAAEACRDSDAGLADALDSLASFLATAPPGEPEERYTALFDLSPVCALHVGYHLFGEAYQRGELLAGLARELREAGVDLSGDLPDFLPTLLRLLAKLPEDDRRRELADALLLPGLTRMTEALGDSQSPWADVVRRLPSVVSPLGGGSPLPPPPRSAEVLQEAELHA